MKIVISKSRHLSPQRLQAELHPHTYELTVSDGQTTFPHSLHRADAPDIIILDGSRDPASSLTLCRVIRAEPHSAPPYMILLLDKSNAQETVAGLEAGADDCLAIPVSVEEVCARIHVATRWVRTHRTLTTEIRDLKTRLKKGHQHEVALMRQATTDSLTGLYARQYFMKRLFQEMGRSLRYGAPLCLAMIDLDNFKQVNDTYGHVTGDRVLSTIAEVTRTATRESDITGRYGGDEICIMLPEIALKGTQIIAQRICDQIAAIEFPGHDNTPFHVTCSIGVAQRDHQIQNITAFLDVADHALYEAKAKGRNQWVAATTYNGIY